MSIKFYAHTQERSTQDVLFSTFMPQVAIQPLYTSDDSVILLFIKDSTQFQSLHNIFHLALGICMFPFMVMDKYMYVSMKQVSSKNNNLYVLSVYFKDVFSYFITIYDKSKNMKIL